MTMITVIMTKMKDIGNNFEKIDKRKMTLIKIKKIIIRNDT